MKEHWIFFSGIFWFWWPAATQNIFSRFRSLVAKATSVYSLVTPMHAIRRENNLYLKIFDFVAQFLIREFLDQNFNQNCLEILVFVFEWINRYRVNVDTRNFSMIATRTTVQSKITPFHEHFRRKFHMHFFSASESEFHGKVLNSNSD